MWVYIAYHNQYVYDVYVVVQNVQVCTCTHVIQDVKDVYIYTYKIYTCNTGLHIKTCTFFTCSTKCTSVDVVVQWYHGMGCLHFTI